MPLEHRSKRVVDRKEKRYRHDGRTNGNHELASLGLEHEQYAIDQRDTYHRKKNTSPGTSSPAMVSPAESAPLPTNHSSTLRAASVSLQ